MILVASVVLVMRVDEAVRDKDVTGFWDNNHKLGVCFDLSSADVGLWDIKWILRRYRISTSLVSLIFQY